MYTKICPQCNNTFNTSVKKRIFCSRPCYAIEDSKRKKEKYKTDKHHNVGRKATAEEREMRSKLQQKRYSNPDERKKVSDRVKYWNSTHKHPMGWDEHARSKRIKTMEEKYNGHNLKGKYGSRKCDITFIEKYNMLSYQYRQMFITSESISKRTKTNIERIHGISYDEYIKCLSDKDLYYKEVDRITERQPIETLPNYEKRGRLDLNEGAYHLDHIIPKVYGFNNKIPPEVIGDINNLQFIPAKENCSKQGKYNT